MEITSSSENVKEISEEIIVSESGVISIPESFVNPTIGAAAIKELTIRLLEPTEENMELYHVNIDIIGCAKNIRCKFIHMQLKCNNGC